MLLLGSCKLDAATRMTFLLYWTLEVAATASTTFSVKGVCGLSLNVSRFCFKDVVCMLD